MGKSVCKLAHLVNEELHASPRARTQPAKVTTIRLEPTLDAALDERAESYACQGVAIDQDAALEELCRYRARLWAEAEAGEVP